MIPPCPRGSCLPSPADPARPRRRRAGAQEPPPRPRSKRWPARRSAPAPAARRRQRARSRPRRRDWPRAEKLLAAGHRARAASPALLKQIAGVFLAERKPLNAAIALKKAEALAPLDPESRFRLVLAYVAMGQREWARPELERLVAADAGHRDLPLLARTPRLRRRAVRRRRRAPAGGRDARPVVSPARSTTSACATRRSTRSIWRSRSIAKRSASIASRPIRRPGRHQPRHRAGARRRLRGGRGAAARGDPHRSAAAPAQYRLGTVLEQTNRPDEAIAGAARRRRRRRRLRRPALRAGADLPAAGPDRRRGCRARRVHGAPRRRRRAAPPRSRVEAVTGARVLVAVVAILALAAPAQPPARPRPGRPALAPRPVLDAIAAALGRDDLAAAKAAIEPALAAYPADPVVHNLAGVIDARRGESRAAEDHFEAAIRLQPRSPAPTSISGGCCRSAPARDPDGARRPRSAVYARLLAIDPQHAEALYQTAALEALEGRFDGGAAGDRSAAGRGARASARAGRSGRRPGRRRRRRRRPGRGGGARRASAAGPRGHRRRPAGAGAAAGRTAGQALLGLLDRRGWADAGGAAPSGRHRARQRPLRRGAGLAREGRGGGRPRRGAADRAGARRLQAGDPKGALGYLAHARELEPTNAAVHFLFGIVCVELNLGAEAYESLAKAVALAPHDPDVNYAMGAVSLHRHEPSEALPYFEAYVRLRPGIRAGASRSARPSITANSSTTPASTWPPRRPTADGGRRALLPGADRPAAARPRDGAPRDRRRAASQSVARRCLGRARADRDAAEATTPAPRPRCRRRWRSIPTTTTPR